VSGSDISISGGGCEVDPVTSAPYSDGQTQVVFRAPNFSGSTNTFIVPGSTSAVSSDAPTHSGTFSYKNNWQWINSDPTNWVRLTTNNTPSIPNPAIDWTSGNKLTFWLRASVAAVSNKWIGASGNNWN